LGFWKFRNASLPKALCQTSKLIDICLKTYTKRPIIYITCTILPLTFRLLTVSVVMHSMSF